ncbi:hypothetical protein [Serratia entomophila]|uniref:hypothetical protein n=1 Tax=Serratia entomophila TaxID=42906 RepID=UPI0021B7E847|nr:hypothetical protein [Serratia entomophila]
MKELMLDELPPISGGMHLDGHRESTNVIDQRGRDMGTYIDANGKCWSPGTSSIDMYPNGGVHLGEVVHGNLQVVIASLWKIS